MGASPADSIQELPAAMKHAFVFIAVLLTFAGLSLAADTPIPTNPQFNRDIRPILSDNCFYCHGPDKNRRKGKLRLDIREEAIAKEAIVPGRAGESEAVKRIFSSDHDEMMPPPASTKKLSARQKETLKRWIEQGAKYQLHWSYEKPRKADVPAGQNAVDVLVHRRLDEVGLKPSPQADRRTLIRRLYSDLLGLPPTPAEVAAFAEDKSPDAYEKLVDRVLADPHYGERMAIGWLDVVRYADTIGYHSDNPRNVWPYRDYVIKSFNENKPFDRFTIEQIAGDLLPDANQETRVASAFNRLLLSTEEGGAQPKDYEARMLTDRVRAIGAAWLGQTTGCCQCHDHKFDPWTQRDFYSMGAFFADVKEAVLGRREEGMTVLSPEQQKQSDAIDSRLASLKKELDQPHPDLASAQAGWEKSAQEALAAAGDWQALTPTSATTAKKNIALKIDKQGIIGATIDAKRDGRKQNDGTDVYTVKVKVPLRGVSGFRIDALKGISQSIGLASNGNFVLSEITLTGPKKAPIKLAHASATFEQPSFPASAAIDGISDQQNNGWAVLGGNGADQSLYLELAEPLDDPDMTVTFQFTFGWGENHEIRNLRIHATTSAPPIRAPGASVPSKEIADILKLDSEKRSVAQKTKLESEFKQVAPQLQELRTQISQVEKERVDFDKAAPKCLVSVSTPNQRIVRILPRGNWMDETGEIVKPALPHYLPQPKIQGRDPTRLDLGRWLVSKDNPLTARAAMNRLWKQLFGIGLSKVLDDLGAQGELPPNQPLLDWLACEFMDSGWDMKHMVRTIVTSDTYKQVSVATPELAAADPYNRENARQGSFRMDAELVRDDALSIAGLLVLKIGGPSVKPYQPDRYWENLNFPTRVYDADKGENQYRRGLYTWWQRSFLHPSLLAFDAPTREECCAERNRSNIPQQALVLLNDPTYVEAARCLAGRILHECQGSTEQRLNWAWQQVLQRDPHPDEVKLVTELFAQQLSVYRSNPGAAEELLKIGLAPCPADLDKCELAAWTHIARVLLNLHETITRA
jgi:hypothetical protein